VEWIAFAGGNPPFGDGDSIMLCVNRVSDEPYDYGTAGADWNGTRDIAPSKNATRDQFEYLGDAIWTQFMSKADDAAAAVAAAVKTGAIDDAETVKAPTHHDVKDYVDSSPIHKPDGVIMLTAAGAWPSTTGGCAPTALTEYVTNDVDIYSLDFDKDSVENCQATGLMPTDWDEGAMTAIPVWTCATGVGTAGDHVLFRMVAISYLDHQLIDHAWGTESTGTEDDWAEDASINYAPAQTFTPIHASGGAGKLIQFRGYRDRANESQRLGGDAKLIAWIITFTRT
jgi:hypothetical protein